MTISPQLTFQADPGRNLKKAFTLIELLVCIVVIAILAVLLLPALQGMNRQAKSSQCLVNLRQIGVAASNYSAQNDGKVLPAAGNARWYDELSNAGLVDASQKRLAKSMFRCPSNRGVFTSGTPPNYTTQVLVNYAANGFLGFISGGYNIPAPKLGQIHRPSSILLAVDAAYRLPIRMNQTSIGTLPEVNVASMSDVISYINQQTDGPPHGTPSRNGANQDFRGGGVNAVFLDGSAKFLSIDDPNFAERPNGANMNVNYWNTTGRTSSSGSHF